MVFTQRCHWVCFLLVFSPLHFLFFFSFVLKILHWRVGRKQTNKQTNQASRSSTSDKVKIPGARSILLYEPTLKKKCKRNTKSTVFKTLNIRQQRTVRPDGKETNTVSLTVVLADSLESHKVVSRPKVKWGRIL